MERPSLIIRKNYLDFVPSDVQDQSLDIFRNFDLARQSAALFSFSSSSVQHAVIHGWQAVEPSLIDIAVAGCTGAGASAFSDNAVNIVINRSLHH